MPKGYRLLKRQGWDGVSGLGKRKTGISQPVAAHKRARNRAGIGAERRQPPRKGKDAKPCQPSTPKETPQEVQTRWKRLQLELSTDLSDDYIEVLLAPDNCGETEKQRKNRKRKRRKRKPRKFVLKRNCRRNLKHSRHKEGVRKRNCANSKMSKRWVPVSQTPVYLRLVSVCHRAFTTTVFADTIW